jgi:hypothetical protein
MSSLSDPDRIAERQWERGWKEHERLQLQRMASLPLADKLAWLEEAHKLAMQLGALPKPAADDPSLSE